MFPSNERRWLWGVRIHICIWVVPFCVWLTGIFTIQKGHPQAMPRVLASPLSLPILLRCACLPTTFCSPSGLHRSHNVRVLETRASLSRLVEHYFNGTPFPGGVPPTFRAPLSPLSYRHKLPPLVEDGLHCIRAFRRQLHHLHHLHTKNHPFSIPSGPAFFSRFPIRLWASPPKLARARPPPTPPLLTSLAQPNFSLAYRLAVVIHILYIYIYIQAVPGQAGGGSFL